MFTIYERVPSSSVLSWTWWFRQLRMLGRRLAIIGPDAIQLATLDRDHFAEGFWLNVNGYRLYGFSAGLGAVNFNDPQYGGLGSFRTPGGPRVEYVAVGLRTTRVNLTVNAPGHFIVAYAVSLDVTDSHPTQRGIYATAHVDGEPVDACTDYVLTAEWGGQLSHKWSTHSDAGHKLCGYGLVELPEGTHSVEILLHARVAMSIRNIEVSFAEIH